jgi:hypothetical protein
LPSFLFLLFYSSVPTRWHVTQPFRTTWSSIVKSWRKIAIVTRPAQFVRTKWGSITKNWSKIATLTCTCLSATLSHQLARIHVVQFKRIQLVWFASRLQPQTQR